MPRRAPTAALGELRNVRPNPASTPTDLVGGALCMTLTLAAVLVARFGAGERGSDLALAAAARLSFLFFWPAYAGGPLVIISGRLSPR